MDINIIDCIPDDKPHCGNCKSWENFGELFGECELKDQKSPSFGVCDEWAYDWDDDEYKEMLEDLEYQFEDSTNDI